MWRLVINIPTTTKCFPANKSSPKLSIFLHDFFPSLLNLFKKKSLLITKCLWQLALLRAAVGGGCTAAGVSLVSGVTVNTEGCSRRQIASRGRGGGSVLKPCFWIWPLCLLDNHLTLPQTHKALSFQITAELLAQSPRDFHFHPLPSSHFFPTALLMLALLIRAFWWEQYLWKWFPPTFWKIKELWMGPGRSGCLHAH